MARTSLKVKDISPGKDPVRDSEVFRDALINLLLEDKESYCITVDFFMHGQTIEEIQRHYKKTRPTIESKLKKGKHSIRQYLKVFSPAILDIEAIRMRVALIIAEREEREADNKFPRLDLMVK